jgi:hypothetical protein
MKEWDREEAMGDRVEDMQQMTTGRTQTRVAAFRTEPIWHVLYPVSHRATPVNMTWSIYLITFYILWSKCCIHFEFS